MNHHTGLPSSMFSDVLFLALLASGCASLETKSIDDVSTYCGAFDAAAADCTSDGDGVSSDVSTLLGSNVLDHDSGVPPQAKPDSGSVNGAACPEPNDDESTSSHSPPYAKCTGCHPTVSFQGEQEADVPECAVPAGTPYDGDFAGRYSAAELPCGSCGDNGYRCSLGIAPVCDFDGDGPEPEEQSDELVDEWLCECSDGVWVCGLWFQSASSCSPLR